MADGLLTCCRFLRRQGSRVGTCLLHPESHLYQVQVTAAGGKRDQAQDRVWTLPYPQGSCPGSHPVPWVNLDPELGQLRGSEHHSNSQQAAEPSSRQTWEISGVLTFFFWCLEVQGVLLGSLFAIWMADGENPSPEWFGDRSQVK